jgi:hypothetical protein
MVLPNKTGEINNLKSFVAIMLARVVNSVLMHK